MKVELTPKLTNKKTKIKLPKANFLSTVRLFFTSKTPLLKNDSFEKDAQEQKKQVEKIEKLVPRKYPNWCDYEKDYNLAQSFPTQTVCYYPEDVEKMEQMTKKEMIAYKNKLYAEGKYYIDNNYHVDTPALDKFDKEHGITWRNPVIKDE